MKSQPATVSLQAPPLSASLSRAAAQAMDAADPLAGFISEFESPLGIIYLNGNSLGPLPKAAAARIAEAVREEWGRGLSTSWNKAGWFDMPQRLGNRIAELVGAAPGEVVMTDGTSINQFRAVAAALALNPGRRIILMEGSNFPTNQYIVQGLARWLGQGHEIRFAEKDALAAAITPDVAVVALTHVHYKTGHILDMQGLTAKAHAAGALTVWDLCHSAGAVPINLAASAPDFAIGCTYKYLNGGPGSPAFLYAASRHHPRLDQPLTGWWGHAAPFAFQRDYAPAEGIGRMLTGTQPILSMIASEAGLDLALRAGAGATRAKSMALGTLFQSLVEARLPHSGLTLSSPRNPADRGGHIAFDHPHAYPVMKALISRGIIGDFRAPSTLRFGLSPLPLRFTDVWDAVEAMHDVFASEAWKAPEFQIVEAVT